MNNNGQKITNTSNNPLEVTIKRILAQGGLTRREYFELVTLFLSELSITEKERFYLNQLFDELQLGHLDFL